MRSTKNKSNAIKQAQELVRTKLEDRRLSLRLLQYFFTNDHGTWIPKEPKDAPIMGVFKLPKLETNEVESDV